MKESEIYQEAIRGKNRAFKVAVADVEIKEAVVGLFEIDELAGVAPEAGFAAEALDLLERSDPVGLTVKEDHWGKFAPDRVDRAESLGGGGIRKTSGGLGRGSRLDER